MPKANTQKKPITARADSFGAARMTKDQRPAQPAPVGASSLGFEVVDRAREVQRTARHAIPISYNEVLEVMRREPYDVKHLPVIEPQMFKWIGKHFSFFVGRRSREILNESTDVRDVGIEKPIHPMGVGFEATVRMKPTRWSGVFAGGEFLALARASLSQGNPFKVNEEGAPQKRSTAMALKVFPTRDPNERVLTGNIVTQNDLNGVVGADGRAVNYLDTAQSNQPPIDLKKISRPYELLTLLGVAWGALSSPRDSAARAGIRPPHGWSELGVDEPSKVNTPVWVELRPRRSGPPVEASDFRLELIETASRDGGLAFDVYAADQLGPDGQIAWENVGEVELKNPIASKGVDEHLVFAHSTFNSRFTGTDFEVPRSPSSAR